MGIPNNIDNDSVPEETKTSLLYDMFNQAVIRGIGNCTQTCQHVTDFLNSGVMPIAGWRNMLPGFSMSRPFYGASEDYANHEENGSLSGKEMRNGKMEEKTEGRKLLELLGISLSEGQHVQIRGKMLGNLHQTVGTGHLFNAVKINGEVKIIDCYQGLSEAPWLKQSWNEPEAFLSYFTDFSMSEPENSQLNKAISVYLTTPAPAPSPDPPVPFSSLLSSRFSFFSSRKDVPAAKDESKIPERGGPSLK